ncbi:DNA-binding response regulator [Amycolatopsis sp. NPDC049868]|uniref:DNA-binding response regulator n=1 Tax=Amycolatopsis sp. NPDC049868 TaxID=3363934 RepID=UPI003788C760
MSASVTAPVPMAGTDEMGGGVVVIGCDEVFSAGLKVVIEERSELTAVTAPVSRTGSPSGIRDLAPRVVLLDGSMVGDGEIVERLVDGHGDEAPEVLLLTESGDLEVTLIGLRAGARGALDKHAAADEIAAAVRSVANREPVVTLPVLRRLIEAYAGIPPYREQLPRFLAVLTSRETEVLRAVATGMSNARIASRLFIGESTVKTHLNRAMAKLGISSRAGVVTLAYESGLVAPGGPGGMDMRSLIPPGPCVSAEAYR